MRPQRELPAVLQHLRPGAWLFFEAPLILDGRRGAARYQLPLRLDRSPTPSELAFVVRPTGVAGRFTAWVSWNGATEVAAWRLQGGSLEASLEVLVTTKSLGPKRRSLSSAVKPRSWRSSPPTPRARSSPAATLSPPASAVVSGVAGASIGPALIRPAEVAPASRSVTAQVAETATTTTK